MTDHLPRLHVARGIDGAPHAVPLVLLHGFTGDATTWDSLVGHLGANRPVLAVDLVGHGQSEAPDDPGAYTMPATVDAVLAAVAAVADGPRVGGATRAHWLGYSMGGRVALNLTLVAPGAVAGLVLIGASPGIADPTARTDRSGR